MSDIDTSNAPYYDDFDADKGFLRVLFRPKSVQARELTQAQTILQEQVNRLGRHLFTEGAMVIPGGIRISSQQDYVKLTFISGSVYDDIVDRTDMVVSSVVSGLTAKVKKVIPAEGEDPPSIFVEYTNSGSDNMTKKFSVGESLKFSITVDSVNQNIANARSDAVGFGTWAQVAAGVYFVRGFMVQNAAQDVVVSKYTQDSSNRIGFNVVESIVTEDDDDSLLSNAQGTPNFKAPGAHRLKIELKLATVSTDSAVDDNFIELARVEDGETKELVVDTEYAQLMKTLAQRTYEESGDYSLGQYDFVLREHIKDSTHPDGVFSDDKGGDESKFVFGVKPSISYVKGYRVQNIATDYVPVEKARDTNFVNNAVSSAIYQNYLIITGIHSLPPTDIRKKISLHDAPIVAGNTAGSIIGTARVRAIQFVAAGSIKVFLTDIKMNSGKTFSQVQGLRYTDASSLFGATVSSASMYGSNQNTMLFPLPYPATKSLKRAGASDTTYAVTRQYTVTTNASGVATVSLSSNETFSTPNQVEYLLSATGAANTGGAVAWAEGLFVLSGSPVGRSITINAGVGNASKTFVANVVVIKQQPLEKTKTKTVKVDVVTFTAETFKALTKCDGFKLNSVINDATGEVVTNSYNFFNGQTDNGYRVCELRSKSGAVTGVFQVTYEYFEHSLGDFFSVDSYSNVNYQDIPTYISSSGAAYELSDCLDFRALYDASGEITSVTFAGDVIRPSDTVRVDVEYYLPRRDSVYVSSDGTFGVVKGVPGDEPVYPEVPTDSMKIAELTISAYTFDPLNVIVRLIDNKRYTMRDIGKLERRIENLEYYTTLSAIESKVNKTQIIDPVTGNDRFKNGFATDGFSDFRLCDLDSEEFMFALDLDATVGQPAFSQFPGDMEFGSGANHAKGLGLVSKSYTLKKTIEQPYATRMINVNPFAVFTWNGYVSLNPASDFWRDVWYLPPVMVNQTVDNRGAAVQGTVVNQWRSSWKNRDLNTLTTVTTFSESTSVSIADNFIQNVVYTFMRAIGIAFSGTCLRPFTRVYPFFEDKPVSAFCRPAGGANGQALVTDGSGAINGVFSVPNTSANNFRTGTNVFRLTDQADDSRNPNLLTTFAQTTHASGGSIDYRQQTVTSTRILSFTESSSLTTVYQKDPIAQTFWVTSTGGEYLAAVDIFMATKSSTIPLIVELRTAENGYPGGDALPFGRKVLLPSQVAVSANGMTPTRVTFDDLVYLEPGREYSIVLMADTQEYNAWICQMGETVLGTTRSVSAQPNLGSFFVSQNGTTWTANQNQDMKFTFYRALFNTDDTVVTFNNTAPVYRPAKGFNPIVTVSGNSRIVLSQATHGLKAGDTCIIRGAVGGNGFSSALLNKSQVVESVSGDDVTINLGTLATATGNIGGDAVEVLSSYPFSLLYANVNQLILDGTSVEWKVVAKNQSNRGLSSPFSFTPGENHGMDAESVIQVGGDLQMTATLKTTRDNLSPVIDLDGFTAALVQPRINTDVSNPLCRYVTKDVKFDTPSTTAKMYVGALLPGATTMKFYYKLISTGSSAASGTWVELAPSAGIVNDDIRFMEYTYNLTGVGSFSGFKVKIVLLGDDPTNVPKLSDFRAIALA